MPIERAWSCVTFGISFWNSPYVLSQTFGSIKELYFQSWHQEARDNLSLVWFAERVHILLKNIIFIIKNKRKWKKKVFVLFSLITTYIF